MSIDTIREMSHPLFDEVWNLYVSSFPLCERRDRDYLLEAMKKTAFHPDVLMDDVKKLVGLLFWWHFEDEGLCYIEHFAVEPLLRGGGIGCEMLQHFIDKAEGFKIVLEVEPADDEMKSRRIGFYQRMGFVLNDFDYHQPPYREQGEWVDLKIMSYGCPLDNAERQNFVRKCLPQIHFNNINLQDNDANF